MNLYKCADSFNLLAVRINMLQSVSMVETACLPSSELLTDLPVVKDTKQSMSIITDQKVNASFSGRKSWYVQLLEER